MSPKSAQRFWDDDMHKSKGGRVAFRRRGTLIACRPPKIRAIFGGVREMR
jgi:hypothetical protein